MASDLETSINEVVNKIAGYIEDATRLSVSTFGMDLDPAQPATTFTPARAIAQTTLALDGDTQVILPVTRTESGLVVDAALFDLHERNVKAATDYRAQLLGALVGALQSFVKTS